MMKTSDDGQMNGVYKTVHGRAGYIGPQWRARLHFFYHCSLIFAFSHHVISFLVC